MRWSVHATIAIATGAIVLTMILCTRKLTHEMPSANTGSLEVDLAHMRADIEQLAKTAGEINDRLKTPDERYLDAVRKLDQAKAAQDLEERRKRGEPLFRP